MYLHRRGAHWWIRKAVPVDLVEILGIAVVRRSLRTKDSALMPDHMRRYSGPRPHWQRGVFKLRSQRFELRAIDDCHVCGPGELGLPSRAD